MKCKKLAWGMLLAMLLALVLGVLGWVHEWLVPSAGGQGPGWGPLDPPVTSVAGRTGAVTLTSTDVGLANVENMALSTWAGSGNIVTVGTLASGSVPWSLVSTTPTTLAGYAISDAATSAQGALAGTALQPDIDQGDKSLTFSQVTATPDATVVIFSGIPAPWDAWNGTYTLTANPAIWAHETVADLSLQKGGHYYYIVIDGMEEFNCAEADFPDGPWKDSGDEEYVGMTAAYGVVTLSATLDAEGLTVTGSGVHYGRSGITSTNGDPITITGDVTITGQVVETETSVDLVFNIPNLSSVLEWTDFELKGSGDGWTTLAYYYHSPDPTGLVVTSQVWGGEDADVRPAVYFTDSGATDRRAWIAQNTTQDISAMLSDLNSVVGGWIIVVRGVQGTRAEIDAMQWSYSLMDGATTEDDAASRSIWRPIVPTRVVPTGWEPAGL